MALTTGIAPVDEVLTQVPMFHDATSASATQLSGGLTNVSYLVTVDDEPFVVRIAGGNTSILGIDREREAQAVRNASAAGIAPETIAFLLPSGSSVTRFLSDANEVTLDEARSIGHLERKADLLRRIHDLPAIEGEFDPYADIERWLEIVDERGISRPRRLDQLLHRVNRVRLDRMLALDASVMCHNDSYHLNVLDDGERLWMIDWEYAGMGDPMWDLAATAFELPSNGKDVLLTAYFGAAGDDLRKSLDDVIAVFLAWNAAWSLIQDHESDVDYDYTAYAEQLLNLVPPEA